MTVATPSLTDGRFVHPSPDVLDGRTFEVFDMVTPGCELCAAGAGGRDILAANGLAVAFSDDGAPGPRQVVVIPRRCVADWFELDDAETMSILALTKMVRPVRADGWTLQVDIGVAAGPTGGHTALRIIPHWAPSTP